MRVAPPTRITPDRSAARRPRRPAAPAARAARRGRAPAAPAPPSRRGSSVDRAASPSGHARPSIGLGVGQRLLGRAGGVQHPPGQAGVAAGVGRQAQRRQQVRGDGAIEVVAAQRGVAAGGLHLEHPALELQHRDVEGAAAEVEHREGPLGLLVEAVGQRRRGRLVQQAQHLEPGQPAGVAGGLALGVVEVGRHGDDRALERPAQRLPRPALAAPAGSPPTPRSGVTAARRPPPRSAPPARRRAPGAKR